VTLAIERSGRGPTLVLLHGVGHFARAWRPVGALLAARFDVVAVDIPGFGATPPLAGGILPTIPALTDALRAGLAQLGITRPHVAGNSMGGAIALELALSGDAASVTAFSPAGFWNAAELRYCQASLAALAYTPTAAQPAVIAAARTGLGRRLLFAQLIAHPARLPADEAEATLANAWDSPGFRSTLGAFTGYRLDPAHPPEVPVTVAWGNADRLLVTRLQAPRAERRLPAAQHVRLGTGHLPYTDDPSATAATIELTVARAAPAA
jgi:pimeloyl-ACP methyl ester carboxylesterase